MESNSNDWSFNNGKQHSALVEKIIEMQKVEPQFRARQHDVCPSSPEGQTSFAIKKREAISFYTELMSLFTLYSKQAANSSARHADVLKAQKEYGSVLRILISRLVAVIKENPNTLSALPLGKYLRYASVRKENSKKTHTVAQARQKQKEQKLQQEYFKLIATINNESRTVLTDTLRKQHRPLRKKQWIASNEAWKQHAQKLDTIFDGIIETRYQIALSNGKNNYAELLVQKQQEAGVPPFFAEEVAIPCRKMLFELHKQKKESLNLTRLRPFDITTYNVRGFQNCEDWCTKTQKLLLKLHSSLPTIFRSILDENLCDLTPRRGKAPESFCLPLPFTKKAYVFLNLNGGRKDVMTGIHELGHAFHAILSAANSSNSFESEITPATSEFFALSFELLSAQHISTYYEAPEAAAWAKKTYLEDILQVFLTYNTLMNFEHAIYSEPHTHSIRRELFASLISKNLGLIDYTGYETELGLWSYRIPLLVSSPGYFANYAATQLGALFFFNQLQQGHLTTDDLISLMKHKGNTDLSKIYDKIGFTITSETIQSTIKTLFEIFEKE